MFRKGKLAAVAQGNLDIAAGNAAFEDRIQRMAESVRNHVRYHSIELPNGSVLQGLQSPDHLKERLRHFGLPEDLRGKRVLDIGAWDGWFTFECERRGASVVAVDCVELETFREAHRLLGSRAEYLTLDVNELSSVRLGTFDIVLFFGVLYHLRHPLLGLEKVAELCTDTALIESFVIDSEPQRVVPSVMEFYERAELGGQIDNWCGPSPECLLALCRSAGFASAELRDITSHRASVVCRRRWPEPNVIPAVRPPHLNSAVNNRTYAAVFHPLKDEYICCYFRHEALELDPPAVFIEVDGYGIPAVSVHNAGENNWQANCVCPSWITPGNHEISIRTRDSGRSNPVEFGMLTAGGDRPPAAEREFSRSAPDLCSVELHPPSDFRLSMGRFGSLVCYFRSGAPVIGARDISLDLDREMAEAHTISSVEAGVWQVNYFPTRPVAPGARVRLRLGKSEWSAARPVEERT